MTWIKCSLKLDLTKNLLSLYFNDAVVKVVVFTMRPLDFVVRHREAIQGQVEESEPVLPEAVPVRRRESTVLGAIGRVESALQPGA